MREHFFPPNKPQPVPPPLPGQQPAKPFNPYGPDWFSESSELYGILGEKKSPNSSQVRPVPLQRIDINRANRETIAALPRVGSLLALQIVRQRETGGDFRSIDDLCMRCQIKPHIRVAVEEFLAFGTTATPTSAAWVSSKKGRRID